MELTAITKNSSFYFLSAASVFCSILFCVKCCCCSQPKKYFGTFFLRVNETSISAKYFKLTVLWCSRKLKWLIFARSNNFFGMAFVFQLFPCFVWKSDSMLLCEETKLLEYCHLWLILVFKHASTLLSKPFLRVFSAYPWFFNLIKRRKLIFLAQGCAGMSKYQSTKLP